MINKYCHICRGYLIQLEHLSPYKGCNCGVRRMENEVITLEDLLTSSGKYRERLQSNELTTDLKDNGVMLINKVNQLLKDLKIKRAEVTSGFRPSDVNSKIPNAAKRSLHQQCKAVDILDDEHQTLAKLIQKDAEDNKENSLLAKYGLWLEHPDNTKGKNTNWVHLDCGVRSDRPVRVFKP